jgi:periplasmic mercuric ion binding protein
MKTALFALTLALAATAVPAEAADRTVTLAVKNMSCVTCPITVKAALKRVPGVQSAEVDFKTRRAVVSFDDTQTNAEALAKASTDVGFPASVK